MSDDFDYLLTIACGSTDPLDLLLRGGSVRRYHSEGRHFDQDVAQHAWRVMVILRHLWPDTSPQALLVALYHDASEALTGDIPAPVKRDPAIRAAFKAQDDAFMAHVGVPHETSLTRREYDRMKCADYLEACLMLLDTLPSSRVKVLYNNAVRWTYEAAARLGGEDEQKVVNFMLERLPPDAHPAD